MEISVGRFNRGGPACLIVATRAPNNAGPLENTYIAYKPNMQIGLQGNRPRTHLALLIKPFRVCVPYPKPFVIHHHGILLRKYAVIKPLLLQNVMLIVLCYHRFGRVTRDLSSDLVDFNSNQLSDSVGCHFSYPSNPRPRVFEYWM